MGFFSRLLNRPGSQAEKATGWFERAGDELGAVLCVLQRLAPLEGGHAAARCQHHQRQQARQQPGPRARAASTNNRSALSSSPRSTVPSSGPPGSCAPSHAARSSTLGPSNDDANDGPITSS